MSTISRHLRLVRLTAAVLLLAAIVVGATAARATWQARALERANADALASGRQLAVNFTTVDYKKVDEDIARVKSGATGEFLASYSKAAEDLKKVIVENKSTSSVERAEAALESGDESSAVVIVGVVAPTTNTVVPQGEKKTYRLKLGLAKTGNQWKVQTLEFVG